MLKAGSLGVRSRVFKLRAPFCIRQIIGRAPVDEEQQAARAWLANYRAENSIQRNCTVTFSRSGGPGGQNVNK